MTDQDVRDFLERMAAEEPIPFFDAEPLTRRARRRAARTVIVAAVGVAAAIALVFVGASQLRGASSSLPADRPTPSGPIPTPTTNEPVTGEPVLYFRSYRQGQDFVELAVYADGRVIWEVVSSQPVGVAGLQEPHFQMRITPEGVERLRARAVSTGLFKHDLALVLDLGYGRMEVRRGDGSVRVAWGETAYKDRFVDATPAQAGELIELEAFFRDPVAWGLPPRMYVQPEASPFVPTHLWVSWELKVPDPSKLPSPAREVLTKNLETVLGGGCQVISIAQAREIAQAMERAGLIEPEDVWDGIAFDMPAQHGVNPSFFHAHPALPHESTCD
jgi:hypothetical protein